MKAAFITSAGPADCIQFGELQVPTTGVGQVLVQTAAASEFFQLHAFIELIVAVFVASSIQAAARAAVDAEVQRIKRPQHSLNTRRFDFALGKIEPFDSCFAVGVGSPAQREGRC